MDNRYHRFLSRLDRLGLDGFVVSRLPNLAYLFDLPASAGLAFCLHGESTLIVDSRYLELSRSRSVNCSVELASESLAETLKVCLDRATRGHTGSPRIGFESRTVTHEQAVQWKSWNLPVRWSPTTDLVEALRAIKEPAEIESMKSAFSSAHRALATLWDGLRPGMSEIEIAGSLEYAMRMEGGEGCAFETIVAAGPRSSLPHASPSSRSWSPEEVLLIDFGTRLGGFCSDLTRVRLPSDGGRPNEIERVVREAQQSALEAIRPGCKASKVDEAARSRIADAGYGAFFGHSTGHGIGLEVHELPRISRTSDETLHEGMSFTVEPGIYLPGEFGIRLEDVVTVTSDGFEFLSDPAA